MWKSFAATALSLLGVAQKVQARLCPTNQIIPSVLVFNWNIGSPIASKVMAASVLPSLIPVKLFTRVKKHKHINQNPTYPYSKAFETTNQYSEVCILRIFAIHG